MKFCYGYECEASFLRRILAQLFLRAVKPLSERSREFLLLLFASPRMSVADKRQFFSAVTKSSATVVRGAQMSRSRFAILLVFIALFCVFFAFCYHHVMDDAILEETSVTVLPLDDPTTTLDEYANDTSTTSATPTIATTTIIDLTGKRNASDTDYRMLEDVRRGVRSLIDHTCERFWEASFENATRPASLNISLPGLNDTRHRVSVIASMNLWKNLTLMQEMDDIFVEASILEMILMSPHNSNNGSIGRQILSTLLASRVESIFQKVEASMTSNVALAPLYQEQKLEAETAISISTDGEPSSETEVKSSQAAIVRDLLVRRRLLCHSTDYDDRSTSDDTEFERLAVSEAVFRLSKGADGERVQRLFDEGVEITLQMIDSASEAVSYGEQVDQVLFPTLNEILVKEFDREFHVIRSELADRFRPAHL